MRKDYLLTTELAKQFYETVKNLPVIDYHNHIALADLRDGHKYRNITELWISSDPYKHRLMRICGVPEQKITGDASDYEKFIAWCEVFPKLIGTPVYDWSLMELSDVLGTDLFPNRENADKLWNDANSRLDKLTFGELLVRFNVGYMSPVASLNDDISWYATQKNCAPSLRGDDIVSPDRAFVEKLSSHAAMLTVMQIATLDGYFAAIEKRLDLFMEAGCRFTDHALDDGFTYVPDDGNSDVYFKKMLDGSLSPYEKSALTSCILRYLGASYAKRGLTMQLHIGAMRYTSTCLRDSVGAAGGFAGIGDVNLTGIVRLLDDIEKPAGKLPRTVLLSINPSLIEPVAALSGSFSCNGQAAIISEGPAWWWCDHRGGITRLLDSLSYYSVLDTFVGMTTDSRNILSFVRHDYFRRLVCSWFAEKVGRGDLPDRIDDLTTVIKDMCYYNAKRIIGER